MGSDYKLLLTLNDVADILPFTPAAFLDGTSPAPGRARSNSEKLAADQRGFRAVRGWLIIGACIFHKHWVVADTHGRLIEITPAADPLPFAPHYPLIGSFDEMPSEIFLLAPEGIHRSR